MFSVSVIIPVYNAEKFVAKAVASAVSILEVGEVILVEDGSPDNGLFVCQQLGEDHIKVKLLRHPNGENRGAGASRNLGIVNATCEYIAFLDADDWYLPHRFEKDKLVFSTIPNSDAAYSCSILEDDQHDPINKRYGVKFDPRSRYDYHLDSIEFYKLYLENKWVLFHTNSVTIRKQFLISHKCFDERLYLHQDTELWIRLMRSGNFYAAEWNTPVSITRRHEGNRIVKRNQSSTLFMLCVLIENVGIEEMRKFEISYFYKNVLRLKSRRFSISINRRIYYYFNYFIFKLFRKWYLSNSLFKNL